MAKKKAFSKIQCTACKEINYFTKKSKKAAEEKLQMKKFCKRCKTHTLHKEGRK